MRHFSALILALAFLTLGFSSFAGDEDLFKQRVATYLSTRSTSPDLDLTSQLLTAAPTGAVVFENLAVQDLLPRVLNGVVYIVSGDGITGSGTIISSSFGLIVTNWHVVGSDTQVGLVFKPDHTGTATSFKKEDVFLARVLKTDAVRDLALLEIVTPPRRIYSVPLGSTDHVAPGQDAFSVSHPRGSPWSYHEAVISDVAPNDEWVSEMGTLHRAATIHTATVDDSGGSGDPLFDTKGRFIGLLAGSSRAGDNFAITVDEIRAFVFSALR